MTRSSETKKANESLIDEFPFSNFSARLTLLPASWLPWEDLAKFLLHLRNHGPRGKILIKMLQRENIIPRSYLIAMDKILSL